MRNILLALGLAFLCGCGVIRHSADGSFYAATLFKDPEIGKAKITIHPGGSREIEIEAAKSPTSTDAIRAVTEAAVKAAAGVVR